MQMNLFITFGAHSFISAEVSRTHFPGIIINLNS